MTYNEALGAIIYGTVSLGILCWYVWCLNEMFFRCQRPSHFFSKAYPSSDLFVIFNALAAILGGAWVIMWVTS